MQYSKLKVSSAATGKLRALQQRIGLTPNLLCRYALLASLESGPIGNAPAPDEDGQEFNAYTLTGEQTQMLLAAVAFVESGNGGKAPSAVRMLELMRAHIHRGVGTLAVRLKSPADLFRTTP
ncbi:DNA sulfur modification protein DndE [Dyella sp. A6]|uniref:DNA sulfur modification protein DndE n=1 Tax=Dyella aluminiiresistens TaxID=3069105 RepID=UPI002E7781DC|nr:DNA sulfur modification protein DndE [Dyella sp. A6]